MTEKVAFVTGAAGGLGASTVRYLAERRWRVFAADFDEDGLRRVGELANVVALGLDVTSAASVEAARRRVSETCDGLDGIVNFAGILAVGSLVEIEEETLRRVLDVNVLGTFRVNRALFPLVLGRKGRIVNVSSEQGWQAAMPFVGAYALSKHAIEAYSDSLRRELMFLDVPVIKIQPGPFLTSMVAEVEDRFTHVAASSLHFKKMLTQLKHLTRRERKKAHPPELLAKIVHQALTVRNPRAAYSVKPDLGRSALSLLPGTWLDPVLKNVLELLVRFSRDATT